MNEMVDTYKKKFGNEKEKEKIKPQNEFEKILKTGTKNVFNRFTLEIIKLFKVIIKFGKYKIKITDNKNSNQIFFSNLRNLVSILEFDKTYPEAIIHLNERKVKKEAGDNALANFLNKGGNLIGKAKLLNPLDFFVTKTVEQTKKKKKKHKFFFLIFNVFKLQYLISI